MGSLIAVFGMVSSNIFFAMVATLGLNYGGVEESFAYIVYSVIVAVLNVSLILSYLTFQRKKLSYKDLGILSTPFFVIMLYFQGFLANGGISSNETRWLMYFLLWSTPAIYSALYVCKTEKTESVVKWIEILMILFTVGVLTSITIPFLFGIRYASVGGGTYQAASYLAGFTYGLSLYFYTFGDSHKRFSFTKSRLYQILLPALILSNMLGAFLPGGRGGFVLLGIYSLFFGIYSFKRAKKTFRGLVVVILLLVLWPLLQQNTLFLTGYTRATAFLGGGETVVNWQGASNRDRIYLDAIGLIKERPVLGYGIFGYWRVMRNPHNLFLEVLLSGGIVYFLIFTNLLILFFRKLIWMIRHDHKNRIWMVVFIYPFTMLMFSGSYLILAPFWFVISIVTNYKRPLDRYAVQYNS